jgi:shikimate kinase
MRVFLIGFMGCGKTTVGKKLAAKLDLPFYDLDKLIEDKYNKSVSEIFETEGEASFRKMEHSLLSELSLNEDFVLSTGGGVSCFFNNMDIINSSGVSVYLSMTPQALFSRLKNKRLSRPLIKNLNDNQLLDYITYKLRERLPWYQKAHLIVDALNIDINALVGILNKYV